MGAYDNVGSLLAGGTPQFAFDPNALALAPRPAVDPRLGVGPVQQAGPAQVVTPMGQVNAGMNKFGTLMNKPGVAGGLAQVGQLLAGAGGKGLLSNDIANLATSLAASREVGNRTQPTLPGLVPNQPTQPAQQPVDNTDANQNGIPDRLEVKMTATGPNAASNIQQLNSQGMTSTNQNFPQSSGNQAGMPLAASQAPAKQELDRVNSYMMLGGLTNPNFALDVAKQEPLQMNAQAQMMEAQNKRALLPYEQAHKQALSQDLNAKLYGMFSYSPQAQMEVERAKAVGTARGQQIVVDDFAASPTGLMPVPKEMIGVVPGVVPGMTMGQLAKQAGSLKGLHDYVKLYTDAIIARGHDRARLGAASIGAGAIDRATVGQQVTALTNLNATFDREQRLIAGQIKELNDNIATGIMDPKDKAAALVTIANLQGQLAEVGDSKSRTVKALTTIGGVDVSATPTPTTDKTKPQTFDNKAAAQAYAAQLGPGNFTATELNGVFTVTPKAKATVQPAKAPVKISTAPVTTVVEKKATPTTATGRDSIFRSMPKDTPESIAKRVKADEDSYVERRVKTLKMQGMKEDKAKAQAEREVIANRRRL